MTQKRSQFPAIIFFLQFTVIQKNLCSRSLFFLCLRLYCCVERTKYEYASGALRVRSRCRHVKEVIFSFLITICARSFVLIAARSYRALSSTARFKAVYSRFPRPDKSYLRESRSVSYI